MKQASHIIDIIRRVILVGVFLLSAPVFAHAESIKEFDLDLRVDEQANLFITEKIQYDFGEAMRHGIYRCIPTALDEPTVSIYKEHFIKIQLESVRKGSEVVPYKVETSRDTLCIKIGDPNQQVRGIQEYEIRYTVSGAIVYEEFGGAEIYWNVTGDTWEVPIVSVTARISGPESLLLRERACYRGARGEAGSCQNVRVENGVVVFQDRLLYPGQGMTIAQAVNRSQIAYTVHERYHIELFLIVGSLIGLCMCAFGLYRYKTKHKTDKTIIPQYEPYPSVKPMYTGLLMDGKLDPRDIAAGIVYLAEQGVIKIRKIDTKAFFALEVDDYEITLMKTLGPEIDAFERQLLELFFKDMSAVGQSVSLSTLSTDQSRRAQNYRILESLSQALALDLKVNGFYEGNIVHTRHIGRVLIVLKVGLAGMLAIAFFDAEALTQISFHAALTIAGIVLISILLIKSFERRRTQKGYEALDHLKGFKDFLSVTDTQRYIFHNAPEKNAEQFMQFLPYAIAFGVEKEWAKTFVSITIPNPSWYEGNDMSAFNAVALTDSLGGFSRSLASTSGTSSGGGRASYGGGFSGGGRGGGGGGSW